MDFLKKEGAKKLKMKKWTEPLKNTKLHFAKNKLLHRHFSRIFT